MRDTRRQNIELEDVNKCSKEQTEWKKTMCGGICMYAWVCVYVCICAYIDI